MPTNYSLTNRGERIATGFGKVNPHKPECTAPGSRSLKLCHHLIKTILQEEHLLETEA